MAEIQKPEYRGAKRLNIASAKATGRSPSNISLPQSFKPTHELQMAKIVAEGTLDIIDAYQAAKQTATRLEVSEEDALLQKHIGEQKMKVTGNLITAGPNQLLPGDMESNFIADGHKIGEDTITPYVVSEELSDDAKKLIQPKIDAANNAFNIDTQNEFTKELVRRSKLRIEYTRKENISNFQGYMNNATREGMKIPTSMFSPNKNEGAIKSHKSWEAYLQTEVKNKNLDKEQAELSLFEHKQNLAGIILNRHLAQNPKEAMDQYEKGFKVKRVGGPADGYDDIYVGGYEVGGVSVDSSRIATFIDSFVRDQRLKKERDETNAFNVNIKSYAENQSDIALKMFATRSTEGIQILRSSMNGQLRDIPDDMDKFIPKYELLDPENPNYDPLLTKQTLEEVVHIAVKGRKALIKETEQNQLRLFDSHLKYDLFDSGLEYQAGRRNEYYEFDKSRGGWRPKQKAIQTFADRYQIDSTVVETLMTNTIRGQSWKGAGSGLPHGEGPGTFETFQKQVLNWHRKQIFVDTGLRRGAKDTGEEVISNPLHLGPGKLLYKQLNSTQRFAMDQMVTDLKDLQNIYENYKVVRSDENPNGIGSLQRLEEVLEEYTSKFIVGGRQKIQGQVWNDIRRIALDQRIINLRNAPIGTMLRDLDYFNTVLNIGKEDEDGNIIKMTEDIKYKTYMRLNEFGINTVNYDDFLPVPEAMWMLDQQLNGISKQDVDQKERLTEVINKTISP